MREINIVDNVATHETWGVRELDPETGLPLLPEDYFWRITEGGPYYSFHHVELRRWKTPTALVKRLTKRRASERMAYFPVEKKKYSAIAVLDAAFYVLYKYDQEEAERIAADLTVVPAFGNYPPEALEV